MRDTIFLWNTQTENHIADHDVTPEQAEYVVERAAPPYPQNVGGAKRSVWGQASEGRFLQVIFVEVFADDVSYEEFERLELYERAALERGEPAVRIIHARDLTNDEKRQLRRRNRGRR